MFAAEIRESLRSRRKKSIKKNNLSQIVMNIENTKYEVFPIVCRTLGWKTCTDEDNLEWDVYWTDSGHGIEKLVRKAMSFQRINHIPGMVNIYRKSCLARSMLKMQRIFGDLYDSFPKTWTLPYEMNEVVKYLSGPEDRCCIIKPSGGAQGKGIFLVLEGKYLPMYKEDSIAQEYINKPLLIDGLKFDLRVYVLVISCDPLRILVYRDGLVRLCTNPYSAPTRENVRDTFMHLTNYAVNKYSANFVQSNSASEDSSSKRSLKWLWKWMEEKGMKSRMVWRRICDVVVKTLISVQSTLAHTFRTLKLGSDDKSPFTCFEVLGFDIMLTEALTPVMLEVNHTPSFRCDSQLDKRIKEGLLSDTLRLLNVTPEERREYYHRSSAVSQERLYGSTFESSDEKGRRCAPRAKSVRSHWEKYKENEARCLGGFDLVYPTEEYPNQPTKGMQSLYDALLVDVAKVYLMGGGLSAIAPTENAGSVRGSINEKEALAAAATAAVVCDVEGKSKRSAEATSLTVEPTSPQTTRSGGIVSGRRSCSRGQTKSLSSLRELNRELDTEPLEDPNFFKAMASTGTTEIATDDDGDDDSDDVDACEVNEATLTAAKPSLEIVQTKDKRLIKTHTQEKKSSRSSGCEKVGDALGFAALKTSHVIGQPSSPRKPEMATTPLVPSLAFQTPPIAQLPFQPLNNPLSNPFGPSIFSPPSTCPQPLIAASANGFPSFFAPSSIQESSPWMLAPPPLSLSRPTYLEDVAPAMNPFQNASCMKRFTYDGCPLAGGSHGNYFQKPNHLPAGSMDPSMSHGDNNRNNCFPMVGSIDPSQSPRSPKSQWKLSTPSSSSSQVARPLVPTALPVPQRMPDSSTNTSSPRCSDPRSQGLSSFPAETSVDYEVPPSPMSIRSNPERKQTFVDRLSPRISSRPPRLSFHADGNFLDESARVNDLLPSPVLLRKMPLNAFSEAATAPFVAQSTSHSPIALMTSDASCADDTERLMKFPSPPKEAKGTSGRPSRFHSNTSHSKKKIQSVDNLGRSPGSQPQSTTLLNRILDLERTDDGNVKLTPAALALQEELQSPCLSKSSSRAFSIQSKENDENDDEFSITEEDSSFPSEQQGSRVQRLPSLLVR